MTDVADTFTNNAVDWVKNSTTTNIKTPAGRTVYMDSNIALTDGTDSLVSGNAKTIPNLFEAIRDMDARITNIDTTHEPSTADAGLYVTYDDTGKVFTMSPAKFSDDRTNAAERDTVVAGTNDDTHIFRISAPDIEFKITSPDGSAKSYKLGAIIEAIQELNRRTMFMDTNTDLGSSINGTDEGTDITGIAQYADVKDGLPAASNGHIKTIA